MASHSSTLAWKIPWMEEARRLQSTGSLRVGTTERCHFHFSLSCIGEGNGHPLQCSCLENPRDRGAWWTAAYGVAQSRTRLKRLSSSSLSLRTEEPGRLQSMWSQRVKHDWVTTNNLSLEAKESTVKKQVLCIKYYRFLISLHFLLFFKDRHFQTRKGRLHNNIVLYFFLIQVT